MKRQQLYDIIRGDVWRIRAIKSLPNLESNPALTKVIQNMKDDVEYRFHSRHQYEHFIKPEEPYTVFGLSKKEFDEVLLALHGTHHYQKIQQLKNVRHYQFVHGD